MCRSFLAPGVNKVRRSQGEFQPAVRMVNLQNWTRNALPLGSQQLEVALARLGHGKNGDGTMLYLGLDAGAKGVDNLHHKYG